MSPAAIAASAQAGAKRLGAWALRRARERTTWVGATMLAGALGHELLGKHIGQVGEAVMILLGAGGAGLAAASTSTAEPKP